MRERNLLNRSLKFLSQQMSHEYSKSGDRMIFVKMARGKIRKLEDVN